jgi:hypothetical protein
MKKPKPLRMSRTLSEDPQTCELSYDIDRLDSDRKVVSLLTRSVYDDTFELTPKHIKKLIKELKTALQWLESEK